MFRKAHGRDTEKFPQRSATPGMGGSFAWRAGAEFGSDPQVRQSAARKAQTGAQDSLHRQGQWLWARRPGRGQGAGESRVGLVWRYMHGRGNRGPPERRPQADPGADEFRPGRRIAPGRARPNGSGSSLRATGIIEPGGRAPRRQEARAIPPEDRYGNEPSGRFFHGHGLLCAAIGEVQASAANRNFFTLCVVGSVYEHRGWTADAWARRAILRGARTLARAGD